MKPRPANRNKRKAPKPGRSRSSRREQKKQRTKQQILQAALELFRTKGAESTTAKEISTRAKIAEGTFFNYFPTKEDLALYFFQQGTDELISWFEGQSALQKAPLHEQLFAIIHRQLEQIEPYEEFIGTVFYRSLQPKSKLSAISIEAQEHRLKYLRFINGVLQAAAKREEIPDLSYLGACVVGLFYMGIVTFWLHDTSRGKQRTLALLDRSLRAITNFVSKTGWEWA